MYTKEFVQNNSLRTLLGFNAEVMYENCNLSPHPVVTISLDNFFIETVNGKRILFKGKRTGIIQNFNMDFNPGFVCNENFHGGLEWYMMETKVFISKISFKLKN